jgi:imidazole glycerol-phosphate synthase subunit HisH
VRIVVCDVGLGNLRSVERALLEAARGSRTEVEVTRDAARVRAADRLVMPGQGGFRDCARAIQGELGHAVRAHLDAERPYLGICLGLQVLFESSEEAAGCAGLGALPGRVVRLRGGVDHQTGAPLKIPHIGWNVAEPTVTKAAPGAPTVTKAAPGAPTVTKAAPGAPTARERGLLAEGPGEHFYFVHSFAVVPEDPRVVAATTEYGERFVSAVAYGNVFACQFHPEKSQRAGLSLLERFLAS